MRWTLCVFIGFFFCNLHGRVFEVCPACEWSQIEPAYELCSAQDTIYIRGGEYEMDHWIIEKKITVLGENRPHLISKSGGPILSVQSSDVTVAGLMFSGVVMMSHEIS